MLFFFFFFADDGHSGIFIIYGTLSYYNFCTGITINNYVHRPIKRKVRVCTHYSFIIEYYDLWLIIGVGPKENGFFICGPLWFFFFFFNVPSSCLLPRRNVITHVILYFIRFILSLRRYSPRNDMLLVFRPSIIIIITSLSSFLDGFSVFVYRALLGTTQYTRDNTHVE